jgi:hypothetical protein
MSATIPSASFFSHFANIEDPRMQRTQLHKLGDVLFIAVCATICGANAFTAMEEFGRSKFAWLKQFLELPHGIPSHDTFRNVFIALKPEAFTECFMSWVKVLKVPIKNKIVAIDGKTSRASGSKKTGKKALHTVSAWATEANFRSPDIIPSCGERLLRGYGETEAEVTARVVDDFCVQFLTYFRHGFRTMW